MWVLFRYAKLFKIDLIVNTNDIIGTINICVGLTLNNFFTRYTI